MAAKMSLLLVLLGLIAVSWGFDSRPYENKPTKPFNPPMPTSPPFNPHRRGRRDLYQQEQPSYLDEAQYEAVYEPSPRLRRFAVPIVIALPPPPPTA